MDDTDQLATQPQPHANSMAGQGTSLPSSPNRDADAENLAKKADAVLAKHN